MNRYFQKKPAFTLIELLVVIAIIGILSTLAIVALGNARAKARDSKRVADMQSVHKALEMYYSDNGSYPTIITPGQPLQSPDGLTTYLSTIPVNPAPRNDGSCANQNYTYGGSSDGKNYTINFCLGSAVSGMSAGSQVVSGEGGVGADPSLVLWYKFDNDTGTNVTDSSGRGRVGTTFNTPTWQTSSNCKNGACIEFPNSGTSYIRITPAYALESPSQGITVSSWIYYIGRNGGASILSEANQQSSQPFLYYFDDGTNTRWQFDTSGTYNESARATLLTANTWVHVVIVADYANGTVSFYKNGALVVANSVPAMVGYFPNLVKAKWIGSYGGSGDYLFGRLDDYRIYNRALSANEVAALYNATN